MRLFDRYPVLRNVVVTTKTKHSFRGVLWRRRWGYLVLRNAEMLRDRAAASPVDGELVIEVANVDFIQVVS